jgi:hypothetical protein
MVLKGGGIRESEERLLLSSGSSLLNLGCSGQIEGAFATGHYYFFCGDSMCGKTWLGLSAFAEASIDPNFDEYRLIYDSPEEGAMMDMERFFGEKAAKRIEWMDPPSDTAEGLYFHLDSVFEYGEPFVYVLDSQDSLSSDAEAEKFEKVKKAKQKGREVTGSYGDSKAKVHSANLRRVMGPLRDKKSILIILNQTRDSFDMFKPSSYSGGRALLFYATLQLWGSVKKRLKKTVKGKERELGILAKIAVRKNRMTGRQRTVEIPIYHSFGIDDVGSCVSYLIGEKVWSEKAGKVFVEGLGPKFSGRMDAVVKQIEEEGLEDDLRMLVEQTWNEVEKACEVKRKRRYV